MPGFLLALHARQPDLDTAIGLLQFDARYSCRILIDNKYLFLAMNGYQDYPVQVFEIGDILVLFEGKIYNKSNDSIREFFTSLISDDGFRQELIEPWLVTADGEFVVVIVNRQTNTVLLFNDLFGRLPVYYSKQTGKIVISREISFVKATVSAIENDRFAVASTLLFGYVPGHKTIWKGILRMPYNTSFIIDAEENTFLLDEGERLNIQHNNIAFSKQDADNLFDLLVEATKNRIHHLSNPAVSLSGGLDSRLIAGILTTWKLDVPYLTYKESGEGTDADLAAIERIKEKIEISDRHKIIELESSADQGQEILLKIKQGMNYLGMAFLIPFLHYFRDNNLQQITGDGGDKMLADLRPAIPLRNECDFINYLVAKNAMVPLENVLQMTALSKQEFQAELIQIVNAYRAINYDEKYAQFLIHERAMVWLFEGEDRNRYFSWTTTPYYCPEFALKALSLPMKSKKHGKLFLTFFRKLGSGLETISNPNWKTAPNQPLLIRWLYLKQRIKHSLPTSFSNLLQPTHKPSIESNSSVSAIHEEIERYKGSQPGWFHPEMINDELLLNEEFVWHLRTMMRLWKKS
jgi:asparagine synthase (glutamine-hydrolysing)